MNLRRSNRVVTIMLACIVALGLGCDRPASTPGEGDQEDPSKQEAAANADGSGQPADKDYAYSPFVLELEGGEFDTVTFKDVGLERRDGEPDERLLEAVAEALTYEFADRGDKMGYKAHMTYDEAMADPSNHVYCGLDHLYIDLWQSESPERWGYSLWSGCSEVDKFASDEIIDKTPEADLPDRLDPLAESIVDDLDEAAEQDCFQARC